MIVDNFDFKTGLNQARTRAEEMVNNGLYSRFKLDFEERVEKALLGCLGEIAFEHYLKTNNITYKIDETDFTKSNSDEFDFFCNGKKIDIKVAKKSTRNEPSDSWTYGYPEDQNPKSKDVVVIGWVDFTNEVVAFYGWISGNAISNYPVVKKNTFAGYNYLTPNHEFKWGALNKNISLIFRS